MNIEIKPPFSTKFSCKIKGRRVTIPDPLGKKSLKIELSFIFNRG